MSLSSASARNNYTGNGSVSVYAYSYRIFDEDDLTVKVRDTDGDETTLTKTTDYTVSGVGLSAGGNVTLVNASQAWLTAGKLTTGYEISIIREVDIIQNTDIRNQGSFYPETHEDALDYLTMIDQQQQDELDRSIHIPDTVDPDDFDTVLPADIEDHAGAAIVVNSTGTGLELSTAAFSFSIQGNQPANPAANELAFWYDTGTQQMNIWCQTEWRTIA